MQTDGIVEKSDDHARGPGRAGVEPGDETRRLRNDRLEGAEAAARAEDEGYPLRRVGEEPSDAQHDDARPAVGVRQRRIVHRTAQLPVTSRVLYWIEHYTSLPGVALVITAVMICLVATGAALGFPTGWVAAFEVSVSALTLVMVFAIQHTQGREQAATQRKLDELLRALPGADESLMMLEEAPREVMLDVEEEQRDVRSASSGTE